MKEVWTFIKTLFAIAGIEAIFFIAMIFFVMSDQPVGTIGKYLSTFVKYVLGFPLVLVNEEYPFFINNTSPPNYMIPLIIINLILQTGLVILLKRFFKN